MGCVHLAAMAGVVASGAWRMVGTEAPSGGVILVRLVDEPMGLPGEAKQGLAVGGGVPVAAAQEVRVSAPAAPAAPSVAVPAAVAPVAPSAPSAVVLAGPAPAVAPIFVPPRFKSRPEPVYPERARRAGTEGRVTVRLRISATGDVLAAAVAESSGSPSLDAAALAAAQASLFTPASDGDRSVASEASATYRFELR